MRHAKLLALVSFAALLTLAGCSDSEVGGTCAASGDCARGLSCQSDGTCGEYACGRSSECLQEGAFQEGCVQEDADGNYDPAAAGLCSNEECRSDRECEGGVCIDNICYSGTAGPVVCDCREDCPGGQACLGGECSDPIGVCSTDCECPVGEVCDEGACVAAAAPCEGVTCEPGETCNPETNECEGAGACDPACGADETCNEETGACEPVGGGGELCDECTSNDECGGEADACIAIGGGATVCGASCADDAPCPDGFSCLLIDSRTGTQCVPTGGSCGGCLDTGCAAGQFCDPFTTECGAELAICAECTIDAACSDGATCARLAGVQVCLDECDSGADCATGFACQNLLGDDVCAPESGACGDACERDPATCVDPRPVLDPALCICVECLGPDDCADGRSCTETGSCVDGTRPCGTTAECDGGYCQGGFCVDCLTPGDCGTDEVCTAGACVPCECPAGTRCTVTGDCEEVSDPGSCTSDSECVGIARDLGFPDGPYACDSTIGCYTVGVCNGMGGLIPPEFGFDGSTDPFDAPCPAGTACDFRLDLLSSSVTFQCVGCDPADPATCREGESCTTPLLPFPDDRPSCTDGSGGFLP